MSSGLRGALSLDMKQEAGWGIEWQFINLWNYFCDVLEIENFVLVRQPI